MSFQQKIKETIGNDIFRKLEKEADIEVSLALKMPLKDQYGNKKFYQTRFLISQIIPECELFEQKELKISPIDIVNILFRCKMLFAVKTKDEYSRRVYAVSYVDENNFVIPWNKKNEGFDSLLDEYFDRLEAFQQKRTLIAKISSFHADFANQQTFFDQLFLKLNFQFSCYIDENQLFEQYKILEPYFAKDDVENTKRFFSSPSLGFTTFGSYNYCYWYASAWLRIFLNLLKISGFITPGQILFGESEVEILAPTFPVFLGTGSTGIFCWDEDEKEPWEKVPDGCLFQSFGYRGISKMWLDCRTFEGREKFLLENRKILELLKNPWDKRYLYDISPTLDILSSVTQIFDLGAKVLLIYCCLEHLFVPKNIRADNKKYIVGGINALRSDLLEWFDDLYKLRCEYAHKGFVKKDNKVLGLIKRSIRNVIILLKAKLCNP